MKNVQEKKVGDFSWKRFVLSTLLAAILSAPLATMLNKAVESWWQSDQYVLRNSIVKMRDLSDYDKPNRWCGYLIVQNVGKSVLTNISLKDDCLESRITSMSWVFPGNSSLFDNQIPSLSPTELGIIRIDMRDSIFDLTVSSNSRIKLQEFDNSSTMKMLYKYGIKVDSVYTPSFLYLRQIPED